MTDLIAAQVKDWVRVLDGATLVLDTPHGAVHCATDPAAHRALVAAGEVALSPLEVLAMLRAPGGASVEGLGAVVRVKRVFGGEAAVAAHDRPDPPAARPESRSARQRRVREEKRAARGEMKARLAKPAKKAKKEQGELI